MLRLNRPLREAIRSAAPTSIRAIPACAHRGSRRDRILQARLPLRETPPDRLPSLRFRLQMVRARKFGPALRAPLENPNAEDAAQHSSQGPGHEGSRRNTSCQDLGTALVTPPVRWWARIEVRAGSASPAQRRKRFVLMPARCTLCRRMKCRLASHGRIRRAH